MARHGGLGEAGQRRVERARARPSSAIGDAAQARAEHDRDLGAGGVQALGRRSRRRCARDRKSVRLQLHRRHRRLGSPRNAPSAACERRRRLEVARWPAPSSATKRPAAIAALMPRISSGGTTWSRAPPSTSVGQPIAASSAVRSGRSRSAAMPGDHAARRASRPARARAPAAPARHRAPASAAGCGPGRCRARGSRSARCASARPRRVSGVSAAARVSASTSAASRAGWRAANASAA